MIGELWSWLGDAFRALDGSRWLVVTFLLLLFIVACAMAARGRRGLYGVVHDMLTRRGSRP